MVHQGPPVGVGLKDRKMTSSVKHYGQNFAGWAVKKFAIASNNSPDAEKIPVATSKLRILKMNKCISSMSPIRLRNKVTFERLHPIGSWRAFIKAIRCHCSGGSLSCRADNSYDTICLNCISDKFGIIHLTRTPANTIKKKGINSFS